MTEYSETIFYEANLTLMSYLCFFSNAVDVKALSEIKIICKLTVSWIFSYCCD